MNTTYAEIVSSRFGLAPSLQWPWAFFQRADESRVSGWKLHLSAVPVGVEALLAAVVPLLRERRVAFKTACDEEALSFLNAGQGGATQVGKFATIYPRDDAECRSLAEALIQVTRDMEGPAIISDMHLGGAVYARYGAFNPILTRDRLGRIQRNVKFADGTIALDRYLVPFAPRPAMANPFEDLQGAPSRAAPAELGPLLAGRYLLLDNLSPRPKGSLFLALDVHEQRDVALVVLKEARHHCLSDGLGRDVRSRLRHEEDVLRALRPALRVPCAGERFEFGGNEYLPLELIEGQHLGARYVLPWRDLSQAGRDDLSSQILKLLDAVAAVHQAGYVHRDLKPANVIVTDGADVVLIDFELSHAIASSAAPYHAGTPGFTSPQQRADKPPAVEDDIFALGSILMATLLRVDPRRILANAPARRREQIIEISGVSEELASTIVSCVASRAEDRPDLITLRRAVECERQPASRPPAASGDDQAFLEGARRRAREVLERVPLGLSEDVARDEENRLWLSAATSLMADPAADREPDLMLLRSAYRGVAGVVYTVGRLERCGLGSSRLVKQAVNAVDWLLAHHPTDDDQMPGLHFGEAGVAVALTQAVSLGLVEAGQWLRPYLEEALAGPLDWPDVTHGAAGQGLAALICGELLGAEDLVGRAARCAEYLVDAQAPDGSWPLPQSVEDLSGTRYTGFAHGAAGIVYFLTSCAARTGDAKAMAAAERGADWLVRSARPSLSSAPLAWTDQPGSPRVSAQWCHGSPGVALAFLRLYEHTREKRYADLARRALRSLPERLSLANFTQCCGLSGIGEILLEASRVLGDPTWLLRAARVAEGLLSCAIHGPKGGVTWHASLSQGRATADLMVGSSGVAHFLLRFAGEPDHGLGMPLLPGPLAQ